MCGPSSRCRDLLPVLTGRRGKRRASSYPVAVEEQEGPASPFAPLAGRRCRQADEGRSSPRTLFLIQL
ncbi:hypothetical protein CN135_24915 [Sinorhizobium meliloti]|nr:hypothetical protein CN230_10035 [Sinorhizobium meliloti]RVG21568.1 hypothetical protein CN229_32080 [Sinorhizobium meliloti]RVG51772.1 hypothetical protein CN224_26945 [Sinorhizobium meliloti]RVL75410.1 hypothetical protein CN135_24915 [Sinorhizobium meliloti]RVL94358.1 hypothetical protein CN131_09055 [Sinorhizobium meliloti]